MANLAEDHPAGAWRYDGTTWVEDRGNLNGTLLASAARTTAQSVAGPTNYNSRGVVLFLNVTVASGTGGLTVVLKSVDPISGNNPSLVNLMAGAGVTATGTYVYAFYPGITQATGGAYTVSVSGILPRSWGVAVGVGDASSYTYSIGYSLIV